MISNLLNDKLEDFKNIYRFEEEYYTSEKNETNDDKGRIDCVFAKIDENSKDSFNTEIYLIELKVDENVIDGTNGINKHLIDIEKLKFDTFIKNLESRINYRINVLEEYASISSIKINPKKFNFWTIVAISDKNHAEQVAEKLIKLTDKEKIDKEIDSGNLPKESKVIDEQIYQVEKAKKSEGIEVSIKFFFDKNSIDNPYNLSKTHLLEQSLPFKDIDKEKFIKLLEENKII